MDVSAWQLDVWGRVWQISIMFLAGMRKKAEEKNLLLVSCSTTARSSQTKFVCSMFRTNKTKFRKHANKLGNFWHGTLWKSEVYVCSKWNFINSGKKKQNAKMPALTLEALEWGTGACTKEASRYKYSCSWSSVWARDGDRAMGNMNLWGSQVWLFFCAYINVLPLFR